MGFEVSRIDLDGPGKLMQGFRVFPRFCQHIAQVIVPKLEPGPKTKGLRIFMPCLFQPSFLLETRSKMKVGKETAPIYLHFMLK